MEKWKDVTGFEGAYQVSNIGRIRGLDREVYNPGSGGSYLIKGRLLKTRHDKDGYLSVTLSKEGISSTLKAHRLVCLAFLPLLAGKNEVDHINGVRDDNSLQNLRWVCRSLNLRNRHVCVSASGVRGVRFCEGKKNPWQAYGRVNSRFKSFGHYPTKEIATKAREKALKEMA